MPRAGALHGSRRPGPQHACVGSTEAAGARARARCGARQAHGGRCQQCGRAAAPGICARRQGMHWSGMAHRLRVNVSVAS